MALTFTLIVAMIGIIYTILQGIISKEFKFPGNRCFEIFQKYRNSKEIDYLKNLEKSQGIALLKYLKKCVEYVRYWRKYKNLKEGGPGRVQTATSCGNTPMGGPITGARLKNQRFSTPSDKNYEVPELRIYR